MSQAWGTNALYLPRHAEQISLALFGRAPRLQLANWLRKNHRYAFETWLSEAPSSRGEQRSLKWDLLETSRPHIFRKWDETKRMARRNETYKKGTPRISPGFSTKGPKTRVLLDTAGPRPQRNLANGTSGEFQCHPHMSVEKGACGELAVVD